MKIAAGFEYLQLLTSGAGRRQSFYTNLKASRSYLKTSGGLLQLEGMQDEGFYALAARPVGLCCSRSEWLDDAGRCNACKAGKSLTIGKTNPFTRFTRTAPSTQWLDRDEMISATAPLCFRLDTLESILCAREIVDWIQANAKLRQR